MRKYFLNRSSLSFGMILMLLLSASLITGQLKQDQRVPTVKRTKRPEFKQRDWDTVFFKDIFKDGFVGKRPEKLSAGNPNRVASKSGNPANGTGNGGSDTPAGAGFRWSAVIDRTVLEDEIKRLQIQVEQEVTTPTRYKSDHQKARLTFSMLALLFAIIEEYDGDVRWKKDASFARAAFARAAANARTGSEQAYQNAKRQKENLQDLVRGGNFPQDGKPGEIAWADVVDRGPIMNQLELLYQKLKPMSASQSEFRSNREKISHAAGLVAALAVVLAQEDMDDADEDEYLVYTTSLKNGALQMISGTKNNNYPIVEKGVNAIGQSCTNCHDEWQ